jgi:hypothetical protein
MPGVLQAPARFFSPACEVMMYPAMEVMSDENIVSGTAISLGTATGQYGHQDEARQSVRMRFPSTVCYFQGTVCSGGFFAR